MYAYVLIAHVLAATIWTGGHLVLAVTVLPGVLASRNPQRLLEFESAFERLGMSALLVQVLSGLWMASQLQPDYGQWLGFASPVSRLITLKLLLLAATVAVAIDARLRVLPTLSAETLPAMGRRVILVTVLSVVFVVVGVSFRTGLLRW